VSVKLTTRQVGDVTVIDAAGRITLGEGASTFRDTVRDLASSGHKKMLLNLAEVSYIDSSGIGEMVSGFTTVANQGRHHEAAEPDQARKGSVADYQAVYGV
jgi:anti-sigma B factor antagonist